MKYLFLFLIIFIFQSNFTILRAQDLPNEITDGKDKKDKDQPEIDEMLQMGPKLRPKEKKKLKKILKKYSLSIKEKALIGKDESGMLLSSFEKRRLARAKNKKIILREKIHEFSIQKNFDHQSKETKKRMKENRKKAYKFGNKTDRRSFWEKMFPPKRTEYSAPKKGKETIQETQTK